MLRVNLIRQRIQTAAERRVWWTVSGVLSVLMLVGAAAFTVTCGTDLAGIGKETRRMNNEIGEVRGPTQTAAAQMGQYEMLKSLQGLAWDVQVTASRWGQFMYDIDRGVPMRSGAWLTAIRTSYDRSGEAQQVTLEGCAQRPEQVSTLESDLTKLTTTFDPASVRAPEANPERDPVSKQQIVKFRMEASLAKPIGVRFQ